jgi:Flp pilus assembly protein TadB
MTYGLTSLTSFEDFHNGCSRTLCHHDARLRKKKVEAELAFRTERKTKRNADEKRRNSAALPTERNECAVIPCGGAPATPRREKLSALWHMGSRAQSEPRSTAMSALASMRSGHTPSGTRGRRCAAALFAFSVIVAMLVVVVVVVVLMVVVVGEARMWRKEPAPRTPA